MIIFFVYIIKSYKTDSYYIGFTTDLNKRLKYHNAGLNRSTKNKIPWELLYKEEYINKSEALRRERFLKKQKNRNFYEKLITGRSSDG